MALIADLTTLRDNLLTPHRAKREAVWGAVISRAWDSPQALAPAARPLSKAIVSTLHTYSDARSRRSVRAAVYAFSYAMPTSFPAALMARLSTEIHSITRRGLAHGHGVPLRIAVHWIVAALEGTSHSTAGSPETPPAVVAAVQASAELLCLCLGALLEAPWWLRRSSVASVTCLARGRGASSQPRPLAQSKAIASANQLINALLQTVRDRAEAAQRGSFFDCGAGLLIGALVKGGDYTHKPLLMEVYMACVISAKDRVPDDMARSMHTTLSPLVSRLTRDEMTTTVLPHIDRLMKRQADVAIQPFRHFLSLLSFDLSPQSVDILNLVLPHLRASSDVVRDDAVALVTALALHISDANAASSATRELVHVLSGGLPYWHDRAAVLKAIEGFTHSPLGPTSFQQVAAPVLEGLAKYWKQEKNELARGVAAGVMGSWLRTPALWNIPGVWNVFTSGLASGSTTRSILDGLLRALKSDDTSKASELIPPLCAIVHDAQKHPAKHRDGLAAATALLRTSVIDDTVEKELKKAKVWPILFDGSGFLYNLTRLAKDDALVFCQFSELVFTFTEHLDGPSAAPRQPQAFFSSILAVMTHESWTVRKAAASVAARFHSGAEREFWSAGILEATTSLLLQSADEALALESVESSVAGTPPTPSLSTFPSPRALYDALLGGLAKPSPDTLCRALAISHHPAVDPMCQVSPDPHMPGGGWGVTPSSLWLALAGDQGRKVLNDNGALVAQVLTRALGSSSPSFRHATLSAIATVTAIAPAVGFGHVVEKLLDRLANPISISDIDLRIYRTPPGEIASEVETGTYIPKVVESKNVARTKAERMYDRDDEIWEQSVRAEKAKKGKAVDQQHADTLARQAAVRATVAETLLAINTDMEAVGLACRAARGPAGAYLGQLIPAVLSHLSIPECAHISSQVLMRLVMCISPRARSVADGGLGLALLRLYGAQLAGDIAPEPLPSLLTRVAHKVGELVVEGGVPGPTTPGLTMMEGDLLSSDSFAAIFPVVERVLQEQELNPTSIEQYLLFLAHHCVPGHTPQLPVGRMVTVLLSVLSKDAPRLTGLAVDALIQLCDGKNAYLVAPCIDGLLSPSELIRGAVLKALTGTVNLSALGPDIAIGRIWLSTFDASASNAALAKPLWERLELALTDTFYTSLLPLLGHNEACVRSTAARAIAGAVAQQPALIDAILVRTIALYRTNTAHVSGRGEQIDRWEARAGAGAALEALVPHINDPDTLDTTLGWLLERPGALGDARAVVRAAVMAGALELVRVHQKHGERMLALFEAFLSSHESQTSEQADRIREGVVVLLGASARHLEADDPKISIVVDRLVSTLRTPSEDVQGSICRCLTPLAKAIDDPARIIDALMHRLVNGNTYGERRGAAYGIAGFVKGLGIASLKKHELIARLETAVEDKDSAFSRQGALFAFELLSSELGRVFEPYVIRILPLLLVCFGDPSGDVRFATQGAAKAIMAQLSGHGVKLVLPALLKALQSRAWRSKAGSVELLGSMAYCAPQQLGSCLPMVVPRLAEILTDTHPKVIEAGREALQSVGSVIRNPEIQVLRAVLLRAIEDPAKQIRPALDALLSTSFVHTIDAPSLALIIPTVERGLRERGSETKKKAAQIVGNMCSLTDKKDLEPYLSVLMPGLKGVLVDPIPEVRTIAAKGLGMLVSGMGEDHFVDLVPWLLKGLGSDANSVERFGAAQGLAEVLSSFGPDRLAALLPEIIENAGAPRAYVREGHIALFVYLPEAVGASFQSHLRSILPCILHGLADDAEFVRDVSMRAGSAVVLQYATTALPLLLPALEEGLFDTNWRIRQSSVQLLGDLLYRVAGTTGKYQTSGDDSDDEGFSTDAHGKAIAASLGEERRSRLLASLYMIRSDVNAVVRQSALHVWKSVVSNTPRTLREILSVLMTTVIDCLGSDHEERRQVASRTLGDLVKKMGDRILPEIVPLLEEGLRSPHVNTREGVCMGLAEAMEAAGRTHVASYVETFIPAVRMSLCDENPCVREAAAGAFNTLYKAVGGRAVDEIVPSMLQQLSDGGDRAQDALDGLRQLLAVRSHVVLPILIPRLTTRPISVFNARALASLVAVAGGALNRQLPPILAALIEATSNPTGEAEERAALREAATKVVLSVTEATVLLDELQAGVRSADHNVRYGSLSLLDDFFKGTALDIRTHVAQLLDMLLHRFNDEHKQVILAAHSALAALTATVPKEELPTHVSFVRRTLRHVKASLSGQSLPGFCIPGGLKPILPYFLQGLLLGSPEIRERAALGLGDLIELTSTEFLEPFVIPITGPLIRIIGDRFPWRVKAAILSTLTLLIARGGKKLKAFLPQLQTTFIKALSDGTRLVRTRAATALGQLIELSPRVDPLINELTSGVRNSEGAVRESMLRALRGVLQHAGSKASASVQDNAGGVLVALLEEDDAAVRAAVASALGAYTVVASQASASSMIERVLVPSDAGEATMGPSAWAMQHGRALVLASMLAADAIQMPAHKAATVARVAELLEDDKVVVREVGCKCAGLLSSQLALIDINDPVVGRLLSKLIQQLANDNADNRTAAMRGLKRFAKSVDAVSQSRLDAIVPPLVDLAKSTNSIVKSTCLRTLYHLLHVKQGPEGVKQFCSKAPAPLAKAIDDIHRRALTKLADASDNSDEEAGLGAEGEMEDDML